MNDPLAIAALTVIYRDELGRDPDPGGLLSWLSLTQPPANWSYDQIRQAIHNAPEAVAYRARPVVPEILLDGIDFLDRRGARQSLSGCDAFCAFRQYLDGVDLSPLFAESRRYGFQLWRVFLQGAQARNQVMELRPYDEAGYYDKLKPFADLLNANGVLLLATVFVDNQDVGLGIDHWMRVADALRGTGTLLSGGNEWTQNGFAPADLPDPGAPFVWSRGSDVGDQPPVAPTGSFVEFHPRRDLPKALLDSVASAVQIRDVLHQRVPLIIDEPPRMGTNGSYPEYTDPRVCYGFARHYSTECAGAVFHNYFGQRGLLMDVPTQLCAEAWQRGMQL